MKMILRKILTGIRIDRPGPMMAIPIGWATIMVATTETRGNDEAMGEDDDTAGEGGKETDRSKGEGDGEEEDDNKN